MDVTAAKSGCPLYHETWTEAHTTNKSAITHEVPRRQYASSDLLTSWQPETVCILSTSRYYNPVIVLL